MKIIQLVPNISMGDAVSNNCVAIKKLLKEENIDSEIYAEVIDSRLPKDTALPVSSMPRLKKDDILLYHYAVGCDMNDRLSSYGGKLVIQYHNITPEKYFSIYDKNSAAVCRRGRRQLVELNQLPVKCLADSEYNKQDLIEAGYKCPIDVCPILIPFEDYMRKPARQVQEKYTNDGYVNFLFVGRMVPNKKIEDVIKTFSWYQKNINAKSRLFLVGNTSMESYMKRLKDFIEKLKVEQVIFPGHISFAEILAYYTIADVFLCMSEHEGFCVPLVEAMFFHVPVVARKTSAIPYTLGQSGFILENNDPVEAAMACDRIINDARIKKEIVKRQDERLKDYSYQTVKKRFLECMEDLLS